MRKKINALYAKWQTFAHKRAVAAVVAAVIILVVSVSLYGYGRSTTPDFPVFYTKSDKIYVRAPHSLSPSVVSREYTAEQEAYTRLSQNGNNLFYTDDFEQNGKEALYTLRMYEGDASWFNGERNSLISRNVSGDYRINANGTFVFYKSKNEDGSASFYSFDCEKKRSQLLSENISDFKILSINGSAFFKTNNGQLYRYSEDGNVFLGDSVKDFYVYENSDGSQTEILYLRYTDADGLYDLYIINGNEKPRLILKNVTGARFSEYSVGSSLYYFLPSTVKLNWKDWIEDDLEQTDLAMSEPLKYDYWKTDRWLGFIPHKVLDEEGYNAAVEEYNKKKQRDSLRERFSQMNGETALSALYDCYVRRGGVSHLLAQKVTPSGILATYDNGEAVVYEKTQLSAVNKIKFSDINVEEVSEDPASFFADLAKSLKQGTDGEVEFAVWSEEKLCKSEMGVLSVTSGVVFADDGNKLYVLEPQDESGGLYCYNIDEAGLHRQKTVDSSVSKMAIVGANLYYLKGNSKTQATLYRFVADSPEFIEKDISDIAPTSDGNIFLYTDAKENEDNTLVSSLKLRYGQESEELSGQLKSIADKVVCSSAVYYNDKSILYLRQSDKGSTTLQWYHGSKKTKKLDSGVDKVFIVK